MKAIGLRTDVCGCGRCDFNNEKKEEGKKLVMLIKKRVCLTLFIGDAYIVTKRMAPREVTVRSEIHMNWFEFLMKLKRTDDIATFHPHTHLTLGLHSKFGWK